MHIVIAAALALFSVAVLAKPASAVVLDYSTTEDLFYDFSWSGAGRITAIEGNPDHTSWTVRGSVGDEYYFVGGYITSSVFGADFTMHINGQEEPSFLDEDFAEGPDGWYHYRYAYNFKLPTAVTKFELFITIPAGGSGGGMMIFGQIDPPPIPLPAGLALLPAALALLAVAGRRAAAT